MTDGDHADDGYTADDLQPHGWSPGGYVGTCKVCGGRAFGAKRVRCCRSCAVRALEAERAKPPVVERREFWWITSERWGHPNQTPAEIIFRDDVASQVFAVGADEIYRAEDCVLIERMIPPGRALTVDAIHQAFKASAKHDTLYFGDLQEEEQDEDLNPTGRAFTLIDGYVDLQRVAEILQGKENQA
ncbi:hypothetical protein FV227_09535 [Methylobacterium sp. WL119]|uniref:hypothetical protein n=1 Tax=Methylobacterium sp. WL93 TaxID=2603892 RepID=UPI0011C89B98|nr:hypothetical protein [Methylobacterium sp. WL93]TXN51045.1 hypothetical protein FV227_09535 [Methylobacterium sp. WL119]